MSKTYEEPIKASHPRTLSTDEAYKADNIAMLLVGERHEKRELVNLVRWLILDNAKTINPLPATQEQGWRGVESALTDLLDHYTGTINSGDCGNWDPEEEEVVIKARKALANMPKSKEELLPCQRCGSDKIHFELYTPNDRLNDGSGRMVCENGHAWDEWSRNEDEAAKAWNTRPDSKPYKYAEHSDWWAVFGKIFDFDEEEEESSRSFFNAARELKEEQP